MNFFSRVYYLMKQHGAEKDMQYHNFYKKEGMDGRGQSVIYSFDIEPIILPMYKIK